MARDRNTSAKLSTGDRIEQLKKGISITWLCARRGIELKPNGTAELIGCCPFHQNKEPSFRVLPARNLWECRVCDQGGSIVGLLMRLDNIGFNEAIDQLFVQLRSGGYGGQASSGLINRGNAAPDGKEDGGSDDRK